MSRFSLFKKGDPCFVCGDDRGNGCKVAENGLVLCREGGSPGDRSNDYHFVKPTKDGTWGIWAVDTEEQNDSEGWRSNSERRRKRNEARKQQKQEDEARERRRRAAAMPAIQRDRHWRRLLDSLDLAPLDRQDLHRRGFTEAQIKEIGFKSVVQWQRLEGQYPENLPGVLKGGRSLKTIAPGYLCPVRNQDGLIVACQVRARDGDIRYYWLTSATKANPDGATAHDKNGELPLTFIKGEGARAWLAFCEGTGAKPHLASIRLGCDVVGAAGGQFSGSPEQVKAALASNKTPVLLPDGGAIANPQVMEKYRALAQLVPGLQVLWWGQRTKADGDVDEVDAATLDQAQLITFAEFEAMAPDEGKGKGDRHILKRIQQQLRKIILPKGFAPTATPAAAKQQTFTYKKGDRLKTWQVAQRKGYRYLLDTSVPGSGKSYDAGEATPELFDADQLFYMTVQARNPTTDTLADTEKWATLEGRNAGKRVDAQGKIRPVTKPDQIAIEPGNCSRTHLVHALRYKNVAGADADAVCNSCPLAQTCKILSGDGFGFKHNRRVALANPCVRSHPQSMPFEDYSYENKALIFEEFGDSFSNRRNVYISISDVNATIAVLARAGINAPLQAVLNALLGLLEKPSGRFGLMPDAIVKQLAPLLSQDLDLDSIAKATTPNLEDLQPPDELDRASFNADQDQELATLKTTYAQDKADLKHQKDLELAEAIAQPQLFGSDPKEAIEGKYKAKIERRRGEYQAQVKATKAKYNDLFKTANRTVKRATSQHSAETAQIIEHKVLKQWLLDFLSALTGGDRFLSIRNGMLAIAIPDHRQRDIIRSAKFTVLLDATLTVEDAALKLGVDPSEIFVCQQEETPTGNLEIIQVTDLGRLGMQRGPYQQRRAEALACHYKDLDPTTQVIDFKKFDGDGAWWRDSRGSNDFLGCSTLLLVGTPCRNINDLFIDYAIMTGCKDLDLEDPGFKAFVDRKIQADFIQGIGRLRANRRPDEKLTVVILSNFDLGIPTTQIKAMELCPEAGTKFDQMVASVSAAIATLAEQGQKVTQTAVSQLAGYSQGYLSRHWKLLQTLLEIPNSKSNNFSDVVAEAQMVEAIAVESSPSDLIEALETGLYNWIPPDKWPRVLQSLTARAQSRLIEALTLTLPESFLREITELTPAPAELTS